MITEEELLKLKKDLKSAQERLDQLEDWQTQHVGIDVGATGKDYPHPYQKISVGIYGQNTMRLSERGIEVLTKGNSIEGLIFYGDEFPVPEAPGSSLPVPNAKLLGFVSATDGQLTGSATGAEAGIASIDLLAIDESGSEASQILFSMVPNGIGSQELSVIMESVLDAQKRVQIAAGASDAAVLGLPSSPDDPTYTLVDGDIWYNATDDKIRARINGATVDIATGSAGGGMGIITDPRLWNGSPGYEYWLGPIGQADLATAAGATNPSGLDGWGWTATSLTTVRKSGGSAVVATGDLNSSTDDDPIGFQLDAASDALVSPLMFGGYSAFQVAEHFLGSAPTKLCLEIRAAFTVASANEVGTFFGFTGASVTDPSAAGGVAAIVSDGTNFRLRSDNGDDAGAAIDNDMHTWRIEVGPTTTEWFIDGVSQGTITTEADIYPTAFKVINSTTNRIFLAWARVYYE